MNDIDKRVVNSTVHREAVSYLGQVRFFAACRELGIKDHHWLHTDVVTLVDYVRDRIDVVPLEKAGSMVLATMQNDRVWQQYQEKMSKVDFLRFATIVYYVVTNINRIRADETKVETEEIIQIMVREGFFDGGGGELVN